MSLIARNNGSQFKDPEPGTYPAICYGIIDIGTQHGEWQGKPTTRRQCVIQWELPTETVEIDGQNKPMVMSKFYTLSLSEKSNLRPDLAAWRGRDFTPDELEGFDLANILGKPCMLSIVKNDKGKTIVGSVAKLMKGVEIPKQFNKTVFFSLDKYDDSVFLGLSDGFRKLIEKSDEYRGFSGASATAGTQKNVDQLDDDIPF